MNEYQEAIKVLDLDHLGIVAGIIDEMELVEEVNKIVGITTQEIVSPGQVMKAMILNGLGFLSAPLYIFEEFFVGKATSHLIGKGILPEHLNDDRLGRALDKDDKSVFVSRLKEFKKQWTFGGICVADSALYTRDNLSAMTGIKWITRVPLSIKSAQDKILDIQESEWQSSSKKGYKIAEKSSEYGNIQQRWLVIESELRKQSSIKQIDKQVSKQESSAQASLRKLSRQRFACVADA